MLSDSLDEASSFQRGLVVVFFDCLGAIRRVDSLPGARVPTSWKHFDVLKILWSTAVTSHLTWRTGTSRPIRTTAYSLQTYHVKPSSTA